MDDKSLRPPEKAAGLATSVSPRYTGALRWSCECNLDDPETLAGVGLELLISHPLGDNSQFPRVTALGILLSQGCGSE